MNDRSRLAELPAEDVFDALASRTGGLDAAEASARLSAHGPNEISGGRPRWTARRLVAQVTHFMALLLWAAAALAFVSGLPELGWAIVAVVLVNGVFGGWQEARAERALAALEAMMPRRARVVRGGRVQEVAAREIVPGDVLALEEGDRVAADARVVASTLLSLDLSSLTGESLPVERDASPSAPGRPFPEATCVAFAGSTVATGTARAVVLATGPATELGRIARLAGVTRRAPSTLEVQVSRLVRVVSVIAVAMGVGVFAVLQAFGASLGESLLFAIGIIVANVPEGLLPAITITLAGNVQRMARRRALVARLSAVETLGAVDVVCTDKTGTLTRNELRLRAAWTPPGGEAGIDSATPPGDVLRLLAAVAIANDARRIDGGVSGDPFDRALLDAVVRAGLDPDALRRASPRLAELPFDPRRKRMSVVVRPAPGDGPGCLAITKGAALAVLERCAALDAGGAPRPLDAPSRARVVAAHDDLARRGLRVLAVAAREGGPELAGAPRDDLERGLTFLGMLAFEDPPREGAKEALASCRRAGIAVTIVTGDHGLTARAVAEEVGLWRDGGRVVDGAALDALDDSALEQVLSSGAPLVFARVTPEQKLRLVRGYQRLGHVVAVTGDGVNDAPALHAAHVGVAMGLGGTDVARAAADVVLLDDDFGTIVAAVEEGRATFANVRKFLTYVLTSNVPELVPFLAMAALGIPPALGILQILAIDLGTDMLPALALGAERPEPGTMARPPRPTSERLLDRAVLARAYGWLGPLEAAASLAAFLWIWHRHGYALGDVQAVTPALLAHAAPAHVLHVHREATSCALAAIVSCQVGNVFACRSDRPSSGQRAGPLLRWGIALEVALLLAIVYLPPLQGVFETAPIPLAAWPWLCLCAPALFALEDLRKRLSGAIRDHPLPAA